MGASTITHIRMPDSTATARVNKIMFLYNVYVDICERRFTQNE